MHNVYCGLMCGVWWLHHVRCVICDICAWYSSCVLCVLPYAWCVTLEMLCRLRYCDLIIYCDVCDVWCVVCDAWCVVCDVWYVMRGCMCDMCDGYIQYFMATWLQRDWPLRLYSVVWEPGDYEMVGRLVVEWRICKFHGISRDSPCSPRLENGEF